MGVRAVGKGVGGELAARAAVNVPAYVAEGVSGAGLAAAFVTDHAGVV